MATGLKSRIIYREVPAAPTEGSYWAGTYKLLIRAKSIPSPFGSTNMVDTSTLEDLVETQEMGRRSAGSFVVVIILYFNDSFRIGSFFTDFMKRADAGSIGTGVDNTILFAVLYSMSVPPAENDYLFVPILYFISV